MSKQYDADYFQRWYRSGGIGGRQRLARKVALAVATAEYHLERPLRTVLDIGCGEGAWRAPLLKLRPGAQYLGFDSSEYAITRYGRHRNLHFARFADFAQRSEEHTSELQSLMRISYAVFCLKKK